MDVSRHIQVNSVLDEKLLECIPHIDLIGGNIAGIHRTMAHGNDPRCLRAINIRKVIGQPLVLLVVLRVVHTSDATIDSAEGTSVNDRCLILQWESSVAVDEGEIVLERLRWRIGIIGLAVEGDEIWMMVNPQIQRIRGGLLTR